MQAYHNLDFASVQVRNLEASKAFYTEVLGFEAVDEAPPEAVVFKNDAGAIFAIRTPIQPIPETGQIGIGASFWFDTDAVDALQERVTGTAGRVIVPAQPGPFGRQITIADPDGYILVFHENRNREA